MRYKKRNDIIDFFDVSIVMSFYKKLNDFRRVLPKNAKYFQRNGIEIIIVLDEPSEEEGLLEFIEQYPFINFKIIINRKEHEWRNHCKVLNVGIKAASFNYILVLDPEVELVTDVIYRLRYTLSFYSNTFATGVVAFIDYKDDINEFQNVSWIPYGSIMVRKSDLMEIRGYDESFKDWGGEDDQIRKRLELSGIQKMEVLDAKTVHREENCDEHKERSSRVSKMSIKHLKHILYPKKTVFNNEGWGQDFNEVIWNWNTHKSFSALKEYLKNSYNESNILNSRICDKSYDIIALIQVRNESKNVTEVLHHLNDYCDGIILLDDGSTDDSYEKALHDKLLVKTKKSYKGYFDDLENRNDLLKLASFFKSNWFYFIDADERFDSRYGNIYSYISDQKHQKFDVFRFHLIDLWNTPNTYREDIPDRKYNGIATRARMFRNKGCLQIHTNREIHFPAVPYQYNVLIPKILLLHYGNIDEKIREHKYELYIAQDPDGKKQSHDYEFLKDKKVVLKPVEDIVLEP
jgi:hypothetical protein